MKKWSNNTLATLLIMLVGVVVCSCASKKKLAERAAVKTEQQAPSWHTVSVPAAEAKVTAGSQNISADCQMMVVRDSMLTISVMPMLGIEMLRIEATPDSICVIDKLNRRYAIADYASINRMLTPQLTWEALQQMVSGDKLTDNEWKTFTYSAMGYTATIRLRYNTIHKDVPIRINTVKTARYTRIDPKSLLQ